MANNSFKFKDNSAQFMAEFENVALTFLEEVKDSLVSQAQRNTPVKSGDLKRSFGEDSFVDPNKKIAYIGSSKEYAIWVEKGTGEYAVEGNGRKGGWIFQDEKTGKWHKTNGMKPRLMLYKAYVSKKDKIVRVASEKFGSLGK